MAESQERRVKEERVTYASIDGLSLAGVFTVPRDAHGFVVMVHGLNVDRDEWQGFYRELAGAMYDSGIASLRFDTRCHGESAGAQLDLSVMGATLDVRASVREIRRRWNGHVGIVATSFGAGPALFTAIELHQTVEAIVLIAPVLDYEATFLKPTTEWAKASFTPEAYSSLDERGYILLDGEYKLSARLIEEFRWLKPYNLLPALATPVLLIHGDRDSMVPFEVSMKYYREQPGSKFVRLVGADHGFPDHEDEDGTGPASLRNKQRMFGEVIQFLGRAEAQP